MVAFVVVVTTNTISPVASATYTAVVCVNWSDERGHTDCPMNWDPFSGVRDFGVDSIPPIDSIHSNSMNRVSFACCLSAHSGPVNISGRWVAVSA